MPYRSPATGARRPSVSDSTAASPRRLLLDLARGIDLRRRVSHFLSSVVLLLMFSLAASIVLQLATVAFSLRLAHYRIIVVLNLIPVIVALVMAAFRRYEPQRALLAADRVYSLRETLSAAFEFLDAQSEQEPTRAFMDAVIERAAATAPKLSATAIVPLSAPRHTAAVATLAIVVLALASAEFAGFFDRDEPAMVQQGLLLRQEARRFVNESDNGVVRELAQQMEELGKALSREELSPQEAGDRLAELGREIEEQVRNLDRDHPFENPDDAVVPPETEDTVRRALQRGMSGTDVMEFFARGHGRGDTMPDMVDALKEAVSDTSPDTNLPIDQEMLDQLISSITEQPASEAESGPADDLEQMDQILQQSASGLSELTEGDDSREAGDGGGMSIQRNPQPPSDADSGSDSGGNSGEGQSGGTTPTDDTFDDAFARPGDTPTLRELRGEVTRSEIMDIIIRDVPSEAISNLSEEEAITQFESVIERALPREATPTELRDVVKSYFLRITMRAADEPDNQGDADASR